MTSSLSFWLFVFLLIQTAGFLIIFQGSTEISPFLGFPKWLLYFVGVEMLFSVAFYFFIEMYWGKEGE